jgi:hypothetical protein
LRLSGRRFLALAGAWALAYLFTSFFAYPFGGGSLIVFSWFLAGALGGGLTCLILRRAGANLDRTALIGIILGWAAGLAIGEWLIQAFSTSSPLGISLGNAVSGLIGGLVLFTVWYRSNPEATALDAPRLNHKPVEAVVESVEPVSIDEPTSPAKAATAGSVEGMNSAVMRDLLSRAIRPASWMGAGWFLVSLVAWFLFFRFDGETLVNWVYTLLGEAPEYFELQLIFSGVVAGLLSGAVVGVVVNQSMFRLSRRQFLALIGFWALIFLVTELLYSQGAPMRTLLYFFAGALGGWGTYAVLRRVDSRFDRQALTWITLGWAIGVAAGLWLSERFFGDFLYTWLSDRGFTDFADNTLFWFFYALGGGIAGLIGGLATFAAWFSLRKKEG